VPAAERVEMYAGRVIRYRFAMHRIPAIWHSEITVWEPPYRFAYRQRLGPFRVWVHEHLFEPAEDGTLARDSVAYKVPGGRLIHWLFVGRDLRRLFGYRQDRLRAIFSSASP
jgi:ligand-binding SRPBCC domain-containing protein